MGIRKASEYSGFAARMPGSVRGKTNLVTTALLLATALLFSGCENLGSNSDTDLTGKISGARTNSGSLPSGANAEVLTVTKGVLSNQDPSASIELIGSSGEIGTLCQTVNDCQCRFDFTEPNGILQQRFQDPSYVETDMIRCLYTQVTSGVGFYDVRVYVKSSGGVSNGIRLNMGTLNPSLSPSLLTNYLPVSRYMCRDVIKKSDFNTFYYGNGTSATLLDPRVWDMSQSYNFYSTSLGADYGARETAGGAFECPPIPNDPTFDPSLNYRLESQISIDLANPSLLPPNPPGDFPPGTGDNTIFPSSDNLNLSAALCPLGNEAGCEKYKANRHDFYVASFMDGVFKQPLCTLHKTENLTSGVLNCTVDTSKGSVVMGSSAQINGGNGEDIIGFAALPDANQDCPNTTAVQIPSSMKWVKLWRFRASLDPRTLNDLSNPNDISDLFCTTKNMECASNSTNPAGAVNTVSVCHDATNPSGPFLGFQQSVSLNGQFYGNCSTSSTIGANTPIPVPGYEDFGTACVSGVNCCHDFNRKDPATGTSPWSVTRAANYTPGGNYCNPALTGNSAAYASGGLAQDVWLIGNGSALACIEADTDANGALAAPYPPTSPNPFQTSSRYVEQNSLYDYVFVVSPPSVKVVDMTDSNSLTRQMYSPKRKARDGVTDITYELSSDSSNNDDPAGRLSKFPLCVLQEKK